MTYLGVQWFLDMQGHPLEIKDKLLHLVPSTT
jgi:hypothetical protein